MNNKNNNKNNGNEVFKDQLPQNDQNEINKTPANRIKKKDITSENKTHPAETKKIPLTVNKNPNRIYKNDPKGQIIKLEDKKSKIHKVGSDIKKPNRLESPPINEQKVNLNYESTLRSTSVSSQSRNIEKQNYRLSANLGKLLLLVAILLFVAWAVIFFYYNTGGNVHMLLALAVVCGLISLLRSKKN